MLLLGELRRLELLVEGFEVPITEVAAACGIGVACPVAAVLALGEHGCVIDAFCHLTNLIWYGNLKGQNSPFFSVGFFCIRPPGVRIAGRAFFRVIYQSFENKVRRVAMKKGRNIMTKEM